jgi:DNA-binding response OmpR family regulator
VRVLLIDHDHALAEPLEHAGFRLTVVASPDEVQTDELLRFDGVALGAGAAIDAKTNGCRELRGRGYAGVIVAMCVDITEGEALLDAGADDFATAPVEPRELITRLRAGIRRAAAHPRLRWGPLELDRVHRDLNLRGRSVRLTARECALLTCLIESGDQVVPRAILRERVWPRKEDRGTNLVEVHLSRLRDKLGEDASVIETVRREGYRLRK